MNGKEELQPQHRYVVVAQAECEGALPCIKVKSSISDRGMSSNKRNAHCKRKLQLEHVLISTNASITLHTINPTPLLFKKL